MRGDALEWGGKSSLSLRDAALDCWDGNDGEYRGRMSADLASFLSRVEALPFGSDRVGDHPFLWWCLHGEAFPSLRPLATRMLQLPPSEAGGERSFKVFNRTLTQMRNRLSSDKADKKTHIAFNLAQLERSNVVQADRCTRLELNMLIE